MHRTRLRLLAVLLTAIVAVAVLAGLPTSPARAAVVTSCSNAACPDPTGWATERLAAHAGYPSNGGTINGANCTNYVAWRLIRTAGMSTAAVSGLGNASTWDTRAKSKGYTVDRIPTVGAVAQWDSNHVAYVEQVNGDGTIVISESNVWVGTPSNRKWLRYRVVTAAAVDHFIHFGPAPAQTLKSLLAPGDFTGDGFADLLAIRVDGTLKLYSGDGAGGFLDPVGTKIGTAWSKFKKVFPAGDFSGDHHADVFAIASDGGLYLYRGDGAGGFLSHKKVRSGWQAMKFAFSPGDFSGDGAADVLVVRSDGRVALYTGNGRGGWKGKRLIVGTLMPNAKLVTSPGDFDGDGFPDIIAVAADGTVVLYRGNGHKGLIDTTGTVITTGWTDVTTFAARGDVTGDGEADVFALRAGKLFLHRGDGTALGASATPLGVTW